MGRVEVDRDERDEGDEVMHMAKKTKKTKKMLTKEEVYSVECALNIPDVRGAFTSDELKTLQEMCVLVNKTIDVHAVCVVATERWNISESAFEVADNVRKMLE